MVIVTHHWPGITHMNVWDMPYDMWLGYLEAVKQLEDNNVGWWGVGFSVND